MIPRVEDFLSGTDLQDPQVVGGGGYLTLPDKSLCRFLATLPLPGVVIFVHGVNSDGEWYDAAEEGLCAGLNARLARKDEQLTYRGTEAGQMAAVKYTPEVDDEGFLLRDRNDKTFIDPTPNYSPVIRFRWGYKADKDDVKRWGDDVWLNEDDYWGGGPFANGCTTLADLWGTGLHDRLFLWVTAQHLNPVPGRDVYACPPRAYYVHAALRLARLIASIRARQADCPVTVVCHSQGNMVGMAAAFLGERFGAVADNYVLANPPYSLSAHNFADDFSQRYSRDAEGRFGRQTERARLQTLQAFFELIRRRKSASQAAEQIDRRMANAAPRDASTGFTATADRSRYGLGGSTLGRVTLYVNPHDQVISSTTVCGIGWLGMSAAQIEQTGGEGVFTQRIFAQGWPVGEPGQYDFWAHRTTLNQQLGCATNDFWYPPSPRAWYSFSQGAASSQNVVARFFSYVGGALLVWPIFAIKDVRINATPPKDWRIPLLAPELTPFLPRSLRHGQATKAVDEPIDPGTEAFDEKFDPAGAARNASKVARNPDDPYDAHASTQSDGSPAADAPAGNVHTEAQLRYEHRARLRMEARRSGRAGPDGEVPGEQRADAEGVAQADVPPGYQDWRNQRISTFLREAVEQHATDHSTTMTHPMHAERALAYDVAIGLCRLTAADWHDLRVEADWRYAGRLDRKHPHRWLSDYFVGGRMAGKPLDEWVKSGEAVMPNGIVDERSNTGSTPGGDPA